MNNARRKQLQEAINLIEQAKTLIEIVRDEEQDAFDNLPESLQSAGTGVKMEEAVSQMEEALSESENIVDALGSAIE